LTICASDTYIKTFTYLLLSFLRYLCDIMIMIMMNSDRLHIIFARCDCVFRLHIHIKIYNFQLWRQLSSNLTIR